MESATADLFSRTLAFSFAVLPFSRGAVPFSVRIGLAAAAAFMGFAVVPSATIGSMITEGPALPMTALPAMLRGGVYGLVSGVIVGAAFYAALLFSHWLEGALVGRSDRAAAIGGEEKVVLAGLYLWFLLAPSFGALLSPLIGSFFTLAAGPIPAGSLALLTTALIRAVSFSFQLAMLFALPLLAASVLLDLLSSLLQRYLSSASMERPAAALRVPVLLILLVISLIPIRKEWAAMHLRAAEAAEKLNNQAGK